MLSFFLMESEMIEQYCSNSDLNFNIVREKQVSNNISVLIVKY